MHGRHPMPNSIAASSPTLPTAHSTPPPRSSTNLECPRCYSLNTKFCYFNNYSQSQPRHFCRSCRRYWTKGGILRNVPIGGGCRKPSKRRLPSSSSTFHGKWNTNIPYRDNNPQPSSAIWTVAEEVGSIRTVVHGTTNLRPPVFGYSSFESSAPPPTTTNELVRLPEECPRLAFVDPTGWPNGLDVVGGDDGVFHGGGFWTEGGSSIFLS